MNHCVAIRANDSQIFEFCLTGFGSVGERFKVVDLGIVSAKFAIDSFKIKTALRNFTN